MKRIETIKEKKVFSQIIKEGELEKTKCFYLYYIYNSETKPLFGIAVSKKLGNAVIRNKLKRQFRNIIDNNKLLFPNNYNYIIMIKEASLSTSFKEIDNLMKQTLEKVKK
jgi:ribonuclease P protein component